MKKSKAVFLSLVIESEGEGYLAKCPGIQGAFAEGAGEWGANKHGALPGFQFPRP